MEKGSYLKKATLDDAVSALLDRMRDRAPTEIQRVPVADAAGRICAEWVVADLSSPPYDSAAMDGVAVVASDTEGASETHPVTLNVPDQAVLVDTGNPIPDGFNAVVMVEYVVAHGDDKVEIMAPAIPGQHVRLAGEDIAVGDPIIAPGDKITPFTQGLLLAGGHVSVPVRKRPVVYIVPTGKELVKPGTKLEKGELIEYNSVMLSGLVCDCGGEPVSLNPVPDDESELAAIVREVLSKCDLLLLTGGSSAGRGDLVPDVIRSMGELLVHGVSITPGKPVAIGFIAGKPVLGVPGYPVSAIVVFEQFVRPLLALLLGERCPSPRRVLAKVKRNIPGKLGTEEFVRVRLASMRGELVASPMKRGAGQLSSVAHADGIVRIPASKEGIAENEMVEVELLRDEETIRYSIAIFGSYDPCVPVVADLLAKQKSKCRFSFTTTGTVAALLALGRGECHVASCRLVDPKTGEYNVPYVKRYLPDVETVIVRIASRDVGLIVADGNPHRIETVRDLTRNDVRFVNFAAGTDMRALVDFELRQAGVSPTDVTGYHHELLSELQAVDAVRSGDADVAIGSRLSAGNLNLDFLPLAQDHYDFVIPKDLLESHPICKLLDVLRSPDLKEMARKLSGYDLSRAGEHIA